MKSQTKINGRQLAFFLAFLLPVGRLLELPSLLARGTGGDLLIPAVIGLLLESVAVWGAYAFVKKTGKGVFSYIDEKNALLGKMLKVAYAVVLLCYAFPFLLDLEKFSLTAFSDTEPTFFSFLPFYL